MDRLYKTLKENSEKIKIFLIICATLSTLISIERADYNLYLFIFIALTLFRKDRSITINNAIFERMCLTITMIFSLVIDVLWIHIHNDKSFFVMFSWIEFVLKIFVTFLVIIMWIGAKRERLLNEMEGPTFRELHEESP